MCKQGIFTDFWNGWLSASFSTPCSDGEHVYAMWTQCQVACYDLDGNRKWIKVFTEDAITGRLDQNYSSSPVLAGNKLIVMFGGKSGDYIGIRALDKKTGEQIWYRKQTFKASSHPFPHIVRVKHGGIDAIATGASAILRTADGEPIIENLPAPICPPLPHENEVYFTSGTGESSGGASRYKIVLGGSGKDLTAKIAWAFLPEKHKQVKWLSWMKQHHPGAPIEQLPGNRGPTTDVGCILDGDRLLYGGNPMDMVNAETGVEISNVGKKGKGGSARGHLTRAGDYLIGTCQGTDVRVQYLKDPNKVIAINAIGSEWHRQIQTWELPGEEAVKAIKACPWLPNAHNWALMQTTVWPQGNRLYIRAKDSLYCVGDPQQTYHSPAGAKQ